ncbi:MAG TPA: hypothetical protein VIS96_08375 [Terrimicrobiaceae bacterium]
MNRILSEPELYSSISGPFFHTVTGYDPYDYQRHPAGSAYESRLIEILTGLGFSAREAADRRDWRPLWRFRFSTE